MHRLSGQGSFQTGERSSDVALYTAISMHPEHTLLIEYLHWNVFRSLGCMDYKDRRGDNWDESAENTLTHGSCLDSLPLISDQHQYT